MSCVIAAAGAVPVLAVLPAASWARGASSASPTQAVARKDDWWQARNALLEARLKQARRVDLVFLGDSITERWEREGRAVWERHYSRRHPLNLGLVGDETGHLLWRLRHGSIDKIKPKVAVLLIGVNNVLGKEHSAEQVEQGVGVVVAQLHKKWPRTRVLLLSILPVGTTSKALRDKIGAINGRLARLASRARAVHYLDIGRRFTMRDGSLKPGAMYDGLHLSEQGYRIWASAMEPTLRKLLGQR